MEVYSNIFIFLIIFNFIVLYFFKFLIKKVNIYDFPDNVKKIHKKPIPLMGGVIFLLNIVLFFLLEYENLSDLEIKILICSLSFLIIGIADDKYNLTPNTKFLALIIILSLFFYFVDDLIITNIKVYGFEIFLNKFIGVFFTITCILLFVNAFNLFDGINLQSSSYGLYLLLFLIFKGLFLKTLIVVTIPLLLIIYLNNKNKIFMGDSGTLFLGSIISLFIIANYTKFNSIEIDEIFLLMILPGVDMLRLFIQRIYNHKNPFMGDREHLHHYLSLIYGYKFSITALIGISISPIFLNFFIDSKIVIIIFIIFYVLMINYVKQKISKKI